MCNILCYKQTVELYPEGPKSSERICHFKSHVIVRLLHSICICGSMYDLIFGKATNEVKKQFQNILVFAL